MRIVITDVEFLFDFYIGGRIDFRKKTVADEHHVQGAGDSDRNTDPGKFKKPKGLKPASTKALEAIRFGGVPIIVKMPPKAMPNASGSSCLEAGSLAAEQMPSTTGIRQAVVPVLDKNLTGQRR